MGLICEPPSEKWIQVRTENGKPTEYLVDWCGHCGQLWLHQRIARCGEQERKELEKIQSMEVPTKTEAAILIPGALLGVLGAVMGADITTAFVSFALLLGCAIYFLWFYACEKNPRSKRLEKQKQEIIQTILRRNDIPAEVNYVLIPEGKMLPTHENPGTKGA